MVSIYDFIYVDRERIASLYAQMFGGHLLTFKELTGSVSESKAGISGGLPKIVEGNTSETHLSKEEIESVKDPHDVRTIDVLSELIELAKSSDSPIIVVRNGYLNLMDSHLIRVFLKTLDAVTLFEPHLNKQEKREFKRLKKMLDLIKGFIETAPILPAFLYKDSEGKLYGGTIKEIFLSEPIPSFYLKHSNKWLSNVAIVGVKEVADDTEALPEGHLSNVTNQIMESLSKMIIPLEAERIIPIAIMRKIGEKQFQ